MKFAMTLLAPLAFGLTGVVVADPPAPRFVRAGDDFYRYSNEAWLSSTSIPRDKPGISAVSMAADRVQNDLRTLLDELAVQNAQELGSDLAKLSAFYRSATDEKRILAAGMAPIDGHLRAIGEARDLKALAKLMGATNRDFFGSPFALSIDVDPGDPKRTAVTLRQAGLGLPDRVFYQDARFAEVGQAYRSYIEAMLRQVGWDDPAGHAEAVVELEQRIARVSMDRAAARDPKATFNPVNVASLRKAVPAFPWLEFLEGAGLQQTERLIVAEKDAVPAIAEAVAATPTETLKAWLAFAVADNAAPYLGPQFGTPYFEFRKRRLLGQEAPAPLWKKALQIVAGGDIFSPDRADRFGNMGWAVGRLYVAKHFAAGDRAAVERIAGDVQQAMARRLADNQWLSPATKRAALDKLGAYRFKMGYPRRWRDYAGVEIRADDLVGNVLRLADADWALERDRLDRPVDHDAWQMTPQTINAYHGQMLDLVFPAAILSAAYDRTADEATNYGSVGTIVGHELTHGFDDWGRNFDASNHLRDWWAPKDAHAFAERSRQLAAQFAGFEALPGRFVNGDLTLGENIADLGGLALAVDAYRLHLQGRPSPMVGGTTGEQRVYLGWARYLRGKSTDAAMARQLAADPHSPRQFRVNGPVRNIDDWYAAFAVGPGQSMYLAPDLRVRIW